MFLSSQAFKLFDMDGDGMITKDELKKLVEKVCITYFSYIYSLHKSSLRLEAK